MARGLPACDSARVAVDAARPASLARGRLELALWLAPAVAVALAQIAAQLVEFQLYDLHLRALNADSDASAVAWLTACGDRRSRSAGALACVGDDADGARCAPRQQSRRSSSDYS